MWDLIVSVPDHCLFFYFPISTNSAAVTADVKRLPYLTDIDIPNIDTNDVMLLICTDSPDTHIPLEVRSGESSTIRDPYTPVWTIRGTIHIASAPDEINIHF